jgi:hypothetical protein
MGKHRPAVSLRQTATPGTATETRQLIREMHEAAQEMNEARQAMDRWWREHSADLKAHLEKTGQEYLRKEIKDFSENLMERYEIEVRRISRGFTKMQETILGETDMQKLTGIPGVRDALMAIKVAQYAATGEADFTGLGNTRIIEMLPEEMRHQLAKATKAALEDLGPDFKLTGVDVMVVRDGKPPAK